LAIVDARADLEHLEEIFGDEADQN
jgi:hypothetical protein